MGTNTTAQDKKSHHSQFSGAVSLVNSGVLRSGFENVLIHDNFSMVGGNSAIRRTYAGENAPSTTYDAVANPGDEYVQLTIVSGVITAIKKYVYFGSAWLPVAAQGDAVFIAEVTLTRAQVIALKATPIEIVAAPGADLAIVPVAINIVCNYGGTNVFTETDDDFSIEYVGSSTEILEIECTGFIDQAVDEWRYMIFPHAETFIPAENEAVGITNLDDEFAGNAGLDNTVAIKLWYRVVPTDA